MEQGPAFKLTREKYSTARIDNKRIQTRYRTRKEDSKECKGKGDAGYEDEKKKTKTKITYVRRNEVETTGSRST